MPEDGGFDVVELEVRVADDAVDVAEDVVLVVDVERADASDRADALATQVRRLFVLLALVG